MKRKPTLYAQKAGESAKGHHLTARAAYGRLRMTEGKPIEGAVILEFPTFEAAKAWYENPVYSEARQHRLKGGDYRAVIVEFI